MCSLLFLDTCLKASTCTFDQATHHMTPATVSGVREGAESWFIAMASDKAELWLDIPWRPVGVKTGWLVEELSPGKFSTPQKG